MYDGLRYPQREHFSLWLIARQQHPLSILSYVKGQLSEELLNVLCLSACFFLYFLLRYTRQKAYSIGWSNSSRINL